MLGFVQFEGESEQYLFTSLLRPGTATAKLGALGILRRALPRLRTAFPGAVIRVRLDGGFAHPDLFTFLEREGVEFVAGVAKNAVLARHAEPLLETSRLASSESGESERRYGDATYQAGSWEHARRVVVKAEVTRYLGRAARDNARYLVTNLRGSHKEVYEVAYAPRGDAENRIKELKGGLRSDRTSCSRMRANQVRLLLTSIAYVLYQEPRLHATGTSLANAQVTTLRERLVKLGGRVRRTTRKITARNRHNRRNNHEPASTEAPTHPLTRRPPLQPRYDRHHQPETRLPRDSHEYIGLRSPDGCAHSVSHDRRVAAATEGSIASRKKGSWHQNTESSSSPAPTDGSATP